MSYDQSAWLTALMFAAMLSPFVLMFTHFRKWRSISKRIGIIIFDWLIIAGIAEAVFIVLFRVDGSGRHAYGSIFYYARLGKPCWNTGGSCSPEQLAALHHATTVDFWIDVYEKSVPVMLISLIPLCICILSAIAFETRSRRVRTPQQI